MVQLPSLWAIKNKTSNICQLLFSQYYRCCTHGGLGQLPVRYKKKWVVSRGTGKFHGIHIFRILYGLFLNFFEKFRYGIQQFWKMRTAGGTTLQWKYGHCSTVDERRIRIESCMLEVKSLVVIADWKSNIGTAFCYVLELKLWVVRNDLLCWVESCRAVMIYSKTLKPEWLPCFKAADTTSVRTLRGWGVHRKHSDQPAQLAFCRVPHVLVFLMYHGNLLCRQYFQIHCRLHRWVCTYCLCHGYH